jgi:ABC-type multidrug transport system fused ATPase/permease subunit
LKNSCSKIGESKNGPGVGNTEALPRSHHRRGETAGVHEMIIKMRQGYDTAVGEQGAAFSAGQARDPSLAGLY